MIQFHAWCNHPMSLLRRTGFQPLINDMGGTKWKLVLRRLLLFGLLLGASNTGPSARAEGSKELIAFGGYRPWLMYRDDAETPTTVMRKTVNYAYAKEGETINLGSSWRASTNIIW